MKNKTKNKPKKLIIYGPTGVGKTTFAPPSDKIVIRLPKEDKWKIK